MALNINITPKANQDLEDIYQYIAINNAEVALRFFDATRQTIAKLSKMPNIGSPYFLDNSRLEGLRKWKIKGFENYLIFYITSDTTITILRILNAARDIPSIL